MNNEKIKMMSIGIFALTFAVGFAFGAFIAFSFFSSIKAFSLITFTIFFWLGFTSIITLVFVNPPDKYATEMFVGILSGFIIGIIITITSLVPMANLSQYSISMQVFYPNHPNLTITQNCTAFTTTMSGYLNGSPINQTNTTKCILPQSMAHPNNYNYYNPFTCSIIGKNISCYSSGLDGINENSTWKGTILNVSKR